jgi:hypothetical protein
MNSWKRLLIRLRWPSGVLGQLSLILGQQEVQSDASGDVSLEVSLEVSSGKWGCSFSEEELKSAIIHDLFDSYIRRKVLQYVI